MNRLLLFAGSVRREGWKTLDVNPESAPDFLASIPPLPEAVRAVQWDEIEWIHGISSLYPWEASDALCQIREVLRAGGRLVLEQPDIGRAAESVAAGGPVRWLFGDPQERNPLVMNRWGYTPESLAAVLRGAGFQAITRRAAEYHFPGRDFRMEAFA